MQTMKASTKNLGIIRSITKAMLCVGISVPVRPLAVRSQAQSGIQSTRESRWEPSVVGAPLLRDPIWIWIAWWKNSTLPELKSSSELRRIPSQRVI
jgi:hypothetical protein